MLFYVILAYFFVFENIWYFIYFFYRLLHNIEEIKWIIKQFGSSIQTNLEVKNYMNLK